MPIDPAILGFSNRWYPEAERTLAPSKNLLTVIRLSSSTLLNGMLMDQEIGRAALRMGAFYGNTTVFGPAQAELTAGLSDRAAFISPTVRRCTLILDESCDSQFQEEIISFTAVLSYRFRCPALSVLVHDDDALFYWLHREGRLVDVYQSNPGMFAPPWMTSPGPVGGNAEVLAELFESAVTSKLHDVLRMPHEADSKYVCETARHRDLVAALDLPAFSVGLGYSYFQRGDVPGVPTSEFSATTQAQR